MGEGRGGRRGGRIPRNWETTRNFLRPPGGGGWGQSQDQTQAVSGKPPSLSFPFCEMGVTVALLNRVSRWPKGGEAGED